MKANIEDIIQIVNHSRVELRTFTERGKEVVDGGPKFILTSESFVPLGGGPKYQGLSYSVFQALFSLIDSLVNEIIPNKSEDHFNVKHNCLPNSSVDEKIFKECYRILRLMRNFATHASSSIVATSDGSFHFCNSSEEMVKGTEILITKDGLDYLATYLIEYVSEDKRYPETHKSEILKSYYSEFRKGLIDFDDGKVAKDPLMSIKDISAYFKIVVRYYVENPDFKLVDLSRKLEVTSGLPIDGDFDAYSSDYLIKGHPFKNNSYLIPHEDLDEENRITITALKKYKLE